MQKRFLFTSFAILAFFSASYAQQCITALLVTPLHQSEAATIRFLTTVAGGKKPQLVPDGKFHSYSLEEPSFHMEYKVIQDTCVAAMVRIERNAGLYNRTVQQLLATTKAFGQKRVKQTSSGALLYEFLPAEGLSAEDALEERKQKAVPVLKELKEWMTIEYTKVLPKSPLGKPLLIVCPGGRSSVYILRVRYCK